jgi:Lrp/AsnC family leucine-responsive transcriptional regulator
MNLDKKDTLLIEFLESNCRITNSEIAKRLNISKQNVEYRIKKLELQGIIKGYYPVINFGKLGYYYIRITFSLQHALDTKSQELFQYLKEKKEFFWVFHISGHGDIGAALLVKDLDDYKEHINELYQEFGEYISNLEETIVTSLNYYSYSYSKESTKQLLCTQKTPKKEIENLDKTDEMIFKTLCSDKRLSVVEIAHQLDLTSKIVSYRIKKMVENKVILAFRAIIDYKKLGLEYYKLFIKLNSYDSLKVKELKTFLAQHKSVLYEIEAIGISDKIDIEVLVQSHNALLEFQDELRREFPELIVSFDTLIFRENIKTSYLPKSG